MLRSVLIGFQSLLVQRLWRRVLGEGTDIANREQRRNFFILCRGAAYLGEAKIRFYARKTLSQLDDLVRCDDFARLWSFGKFIVSNAAYATTDDLPRERVFYLANVAPYGGLHFAFFEDAVAGRIEGAVFQNEVAAIAEGLFACNVTTHEVQVFRVPAEVFTVQHAVVHRYVFCFPKRVFRHDARIAHNGVLYVLEHVFGIALKAVHVNVLAKHKWIRAVVQLHVAYFQVIYAPKGLVGIVDFHVLKFKAVHFAKKLRAVYHAVLHFHVVAVPYSRA